MKKIAQICLIGIAISGALCISAFTFFKVVNAYDNKSKAECHDWVAISEVNEKFYIVNWQVEQCKYYKIDVSSVPLK